VVFDETNSLVEITAQDDDFKLGLVKKDLLLPHEEGKDPKNGIGPGVVSEEGGQGLKQTGGITAKPFLEKNKPNIPETSTRIVSGTGFKTGSETGLRTVTEPVLPSTPARVKSMSVDPWKYQRLHPLDQILSNINTGV